jgi:hypothetical protein
MMNNKILNKTLNILFTIFHLPSALVYILHLICFAIYHILLGSINSFNYEEFLNNQYIEAQKFMNIRNYIDYGFWIILFVYTNFN